VDPLQALADSVRHRLLEAYGQPSRRNPLPALDELISTILSQNTNDVNRDRAFEALRERFPIWEQLLDANPDAVIDAIRPAGLAQQKGPRIQAILRSIDAETGGLSLEHLRGRPAKDVQQALLRFKGVGPKTAAIVMLFSLNIPAFPVDTHVYRVTGRLGLRPAKMSVDTAHEYLAQLFPPNSFQEVHLNIIRHGREICHARNPACVKCVLRDLCDYYAGRPAASKEVGG
jgi:endonuclease-3